MVQLQGSQIPPDANNFAGIYAFDGRTGTPELQARRRVAEPVLPDRATIGVRTQIQLLRSYADATTKNMPDRLISAPSDRVGAAPIWEYFGGTTARAESSSGRARTTTGSASSRCTPQALVYNGVNAACVPYAPGNNAQNSGNGYWVATDQSHVYTFGAAHYYGDTGTART